MTSAPPLFLAILSCLCVVGSYSSSHAAATVVAGAHTMTQGQEMKDNNYLISPGGTFRLGFFSPRYSKNHYLGIWYNKKGDRTVVWVANRNTPILDTSGALTIDDDGKLKITYGGGRSIVLNSNQLMRTISNMTATLLESGNFVLRGEESSNGSAARQVVLWQSFDYPTNTLLPGMKLGMNTKTGQNWSLTSWLSHSAPSSGAFTMGGNFNGKNQLIIWRRGVVYWTSGVWDSRNSDFGPPLNQDNELGFTYVSNEDEKYFTYFVKNNSSFPLSMLELRPNGMFMHTTYGLKLFSSKNTTMVWCEGFNEKKYRGCECRTGDKLFEQKSGYMTGDPYMEDENPSVGMSDCNAKCRSNCSCIAYASYHANGTGCRLWSSEFSFSADRGEVEMYVLDLGKNGKLVFGFLSPNEEGSAVDY